MDKFQVLPTDDRFKELTDSQIAYIFENMTLDNTEQRLAAKGIDKDSYFEDEDDSFWYESTEEFTPLKEGHDVEDIARQVEELKGKDELEKARARFSSTQEYNEYLEKGGKLARELEVDAYVSKKLEEVYQEARDLEGFKTGEHVNKPEEIEPVMTPKDKETIKEAIDLFEGKHPKSDDEDDFYF